MFLGDPSTNCHLQPTCATDEIQNLILGELELAGEHMNSGRRFCCPFSNQLSMPLVLTESLALKAYVAQKRRRCASNEYLDRLRLSLLLSLPGDPSLLQNPIRMGLLKFSRDEK